MATYKIQSTNLSGSEIQDLVNYVEHWYKDVKDDKLPREIVIKIEDYPNEEQTYPYVRDVKIVNNFDE